MKLDLSKFKKLHSDKNFTTMQHEDGHSLKIAHSALSHKVRKQLEQLPAADTAQANTQSQTEAMHPAQNFDDGGEVADLPASSAPPPPTADDPELAAPSDSPPSSAPPESDEQDTGPTLDAQKEGDKIKDLYKTSTIDPISIPSSYSNNGATSDANVPHAYTMGQQAINQQAAAAGNLGREQAAVADKHMQDISEAKANVETHYNDLNTELNNWKQDVADQKIDPNRYMSNMGTTQRVLTGLGLFIGGLGGSTQVQDFLNKQIDRDIDAQKANIGKQENLMSINLRQFGNETQAADMSRMQMLAFYQAQAEKMAASAQTPQAQANAKQALAQMEMEQAKYQQQFAVTQALKGSADPTSGAGSEGAYKQMLNAASVVSPEAYKDAQAKYIPGVGVASRPVDKEDFQTFTAMNELRRTLSRADTFARTNGTVAPGTVAAQEAADIQNKLQLSMGELVNLKRINEFEAKKYTDMAQNPGQWRTAAARQSFKDLAQDANDREGALSSSLGVKRFSDAPSIQAPQVSTNAETRTVNGVQYQKVQGGWKKVS